MTNSSNLASFWCFCQPCGDIQYKGKPKLKLELGYKGGRKWKYSQANILKKGVGMGSTGAMSCNPAIDER